MQVTNANDVLRTTKRQENFAQYKGMGEYEVYYSPQNDSDSDIANWLSSKASKSNKTSFYDTYELSTKEATSKKNRKN